MNKIEYVLDTIKGGLQELLDTNQKYARVGKVYYAGGTLVIDVTHKEDDELIGILMLNISDECYKTFSKYIYLLTAERHTILNVIKNPVFVICLILI